MPALEDVVRIIMIGSGALAVIASVLLVALGVWLRRQSAETQSRFRERTTHFNDEMLKVLGGTAYANAVLMVGTLVVGVVVAIVLLGLSLFR